MYPIPFPMGLLILELVFFFPVTAYPIMWGLIFENFLIPNVKRFRLNFKYFSNEGFATCVTSKKERIKNNKVNDNLQTSEQHDRKQEVK